MSRSSAASASRRPRRPGDARHDPDGLNEAELLDEHPAPRRAGSNAREPVACSEVWLLRARTDCPKCGGRSAVFAMIGRPEFDTADRPSTLLCRIAELPPALDHAVRTFGKGRWRRDRSERAAGAHWHSHCERCDARIGEAHTLGPKGPFQPRLYKQRIAIRHEVVRGPFVLADAQRQASPALLAWMDWLTLRARKARPAARKAAKGPVRSGRAPRPAPAA